MMIPDPHYLVFKKVISCYLGLLYSVGEGLIYNTCGGKKDYGN